MADPSSSRHHLCCPQGLRRHHRFAVSFDDMPTPFFEKAILERYR